MPKFVYSSDQLPPHTDDRARFRSWSDTFASCLGPSDLVPNYDIPFSATLEFMPAGNAMVMRQQSTVGYWARTRQHVSGEMRGDFLLGFNRSTSQTSITQRNREAVLVTGELTLFTGAEPVQARAAGEMAVLGIGVPRARLIERVCQAEDLTATTLDATTPAARHLRGYVEFLLTADTATDDPLLVAHVETTLLDLVALTLGANRDFAELGRMRGLRVARLQQILGAIKAHYADPSFGVHRVARALGLSPRYVNDLLQDTGRSLSERVLELRLQKARTMLADPHHDRLRIVEIGYECGFNDVSYFNRCFRRRFGASPTQFRGLEPGNA